MLVEKRLGSREEQDRRCSSLYNGSALDVAGEKPSFKDPGGLK